MFTGRLASRPTAALSKASNQFCIRTQYRSTSAALRRSCFGGSRHELCSSAPPNSRRANARLYSGVSCVAKKRSKTAAEPKSEAELTEKAQPAEEQPKTERQPKSKKAGNVEVAPDNETTAQDGDFVEVHFTCLLKDGRQYDTTRGNDPFLYQVGSGTVIDGFDKAVIGLSVGEKGTRSVSPAEAYGEYDEEIVYVLPTSETPAESEVGMRLLMEDEEGNEMLTTVTDRNEEETELDFNHELAGQALRVDVELISLRKESTVQKATFAAGRFWALQLRFERLPGVLATMAGYSQGEGTEVTYDEVTSGSTGHAEVVQVTYDPKDVSYQQLLESFSEWHDPTQLNRQGEDIGSHYRSGIYTHNEQQAALAKEHISKLNEKLGGTVVTEVQDVSNFVAAAEEHQHYLACGGQFGEPQSEEKGSSDAVRDIG